MDVANGGPAALLSIDRCHRLQRLFPCTYRFEFQSEVSLLRAEITVHKPSTYPKWATQGETYLRIMNPNRLISPSFSFPASCFSLPLYVGFRALHGTHTISLSSALPSLCLPLLLNGNSASQLIPARSLPSSLVSPGVSSLRIKV